MSKLVNFIFKLFISKFYCNNRKDEDLLLFVELTQWQ